MSNPDIGSETSQNDWVIPIQAMIYFPQQFPVLLFGLMKLENFHHCQLNQWTEYWNH